MSDSPSSGGSENLHGTIPEVEDVAPVDSSAASGADIVDGGRQQHLGIQNYSTTDAIRFLAAQRISNVAVKTALEMASIFIDQQRSQNEIIKALSVKSAIQETQIEAEKKHKPLFKVINILSPIIGGLGIESIANDRGNIGIALIIIALSIYVTSIFVEGKK